MMRVLRWRTLLTLAAAAALVWVGGAAAENRDEPLDCEIVRGGRGLLANACSALLPSQLVSADVIVLYCGRL